MNKNKWLYLTPLLLACASIDSQAASSDNEETVSNGGYTFIVKRLASPSTTQDSAYTPEELRQIEPMALPQLPGVPPTSNVSSSAKQGNPVLIPGVPDATNAGKDPQANSYLYPFPYTKAEVVDNYTVYPYSAIGVVVSKFGSLISSCSGSAVNSTGGSFVMTAAHCVYSNGKYADSVTFIPAYKNGFAPKGQWPASSYLVFEEYKQNPYPGPLDIAGIGVVKNGSGKALHTIVGALGFAANVDAQQHWNSFGYPKAPDPYDGERLRTCQASLGAQDFYTPPTLGIGCDMGGGSSGGPWIVNFQRNTKPSKQTPLVNMINGMNDYSYNSFPNAMFSPYFGDAAVSLREALVQQGY